MPWLNVFANSQCGVSLSQDAVFGSVIPIADVDVYQELELTGDQVVYSYAPAVDVSLPPPGGVVAKGSFGSDNNWSVVVPAGSMAGRLFRARVNTFGVEGGEGAATFGPVYQGGGDALTFSSSVEQIGNPDPPVWHEFTVPTGPNDWLGLGAKVQSGSADGYEIEWQVWVGQPPRNRTIELRYSNDGGHNFSPWRLMDAGDTGSFLKSLIVRRLGMARHRIWEFRDTSSVSNDLLAVSVQAK